MRVLSKFRHPNLVILMGFAKNGPQRLLVYEHLGGGDVFRRLQRCQDPAGSSDGNRITWIELNRIRCLSEVIISVLADLPALQLASENQHSLRRSLWIVASSQLHAEGLLCLRKQFVCSHAGVSSRHQMPQHLVGRSLR